MSLIQRFIEHLATSGWVGPSSRVMVGYSGGADSTCLLVLLKEAGVDVCAAHLNHRQRPEAEDELNQCRAVCESLRVDFTPGHADVPLIAHQLKIGLEEAGRHARYDFFRQAARYTGAHLIATAHTQDDLVESVILNMARGCGLHGLTGIPAYRDGIIRPLLPFTRADTRQFCQDRGLWTHDDPANLDESFARVRVRRRVVPELDALNPRAVDHIAELAGLVTAEDQYLDGAAAALLEQCEDRLNGPLYFLTRDCEVNLNRAMLQEAPKVLVRRGLMLVVKLLGGQIRRDQVEQTVSALNHPEPTSITFEGGEVVVEIREDQVHLRRLDPTSPYRYPLTVPGETVSDEFGWQFLAHPVNRPKDPREKEDLQVFLALEKVRGNLYFKSAGNGECMVPLGLGGEKKIHQILADAKLTLAARQRLPILMDMAGPIWVPGLALADRVKLDPSTDRVLRVEFGPLAVG